MKILVIGGGGREHAICETLLKSPLVKKVIVAPGNGGMQATAPILEMAPVNISDTQGLLNLALKEKIDLTIVGPEDCLALGVVDLFLEHGLLIMGPSQMASALEASKSFAKKVMLANGVPTAAYEEFRDADIAIKYIEESKNFQMVVKCDALAQGKGVIVCQNKNEARLAVLSFMKEKLLGDNRQHIIIEEFLEGIEVSAFALCDGQDFAFLGTACDHKRLRDGDLGPNTGGMGVFSPATVVSKNDEEWISENVFRPMIDGMKKSGMPFSGILFAGLMKTNVQKYDSWKVIEFNVRFGDPETQVLLPLINEDLLPWLMASARGEIKKLQNELGRTSPLIKDKKGIHVVMAAHGYPGTEGVKVRSGDVISFDEGFKLGTDESLFYAGVVKKDGQLLTNGGRILGVTCLKDSFSEARKKAYENISHIHFEGAQFRRDIGKGQD